MELGAIWTVAADGSGDYQFIQDAVNTVPDDNTERVTIHIKNGIYKEKLHIEKPLVSLVGESAEHTIITYDDYALKTFPNGELYHTFNSYSVFIGADDFQAERISFINSAGRGSEVGQALAVYVEGDRVSFKQCRFLGYQDTVFTGPLPLQPIDRSNFGGPQEGKPRRKLRQYYEDCYIEGDVDFIFGSATALFHRCEIFSKNRRVEADEINGWVTAPSTPEDVPFGYVFLACKLTGDAPPRSVYLGRPWRDHAKTAYLHCWLGDHIKPEGWHNWNKPQAESSTAFVEYKNVGPGAVATERVSWSRQLNDQEAELFNPANILCGEDGWLPYDSTGSTK
ncbi:MAG: pectinesterase family protein [Candidatus Pristimantibacillus sp.]